jgi:cell volume regulation protein A
VLDRLFAARAARSEDEVIGDFIFEANASAASLATLYGLPVPPEEMALNLAELLRRRLGRKLVVGDRTDLGPAQLVVAEMDADGIAKIGLLLHRRRSPARGTVVTLRRRWRKLRRRILRS